MDYLIIIIIVALAFFIYFKSVSRKTNKGARSLAEIYSIILDRIYRKRANLKKIIAFFNEKSTLSNSEIRQYLGISDRVVVNYMDELEKMGKVEQVGETGRSVYYKLKKR